MIQEGEKMLEVLVDLGLSPREALGYLTLLQLGSANAGAVATAMKLARTVAYDLLEDLAKQGFVIIKAEGKNKDYTPVDPETLEEMFRQRSAVFGTNVNRLGRLIPEMLSVYAAESSRPRARFFSGLDGLRELFCDVEKVAPLELFEFVNLDVVRQSVDREILRKMRAVIDFERTKVKMLHFGELKHHSDFVESRELLTPALDFKGDVWIYQNRTAFLSFGKEIEAVILDNLMVAKTMKALFMAAWSKTDNSGKVS